MSCNYESVMITIVAIPCFSGAPWSFTGMEQLQDYDLRTMRLPEGLETMEQYADYVYEYIDGLPNVVLVGDSFGAVVALAVAVRQPENMIGLVMSGGFAADPITNPLVRLRIEIGRRMPSLLYKALTLRFHAAALASRYDAGGDNPWSRHDSWRLFVDNTPRQSYVARSKAAFAADYRQQLPRVAVPTLILTPEDDTLIGPAASEVLQQGIPNAHEIVLEHTGHMFRFSHPRRYAQAVADFIKSDTIAV